MGIRGAAATVAGPASSSLSFAFCVLSITFKDYNQLLELRPWNLEEAYKAAATRPAGAGPGSGWDVKGL